jgi:hypothetical protein
MKFLEDELEGGEMNGVAHLKVDGGGGGGRGGVMTHK